MEVNESEPVFRETGVITYHLSRLIHEVIIPR